MAQNILSVTLQQLDDTDSVLARRVRSITDSAPSAGEFRSGKLVATTQTTISLTGVVAQVRQLLFVNTHSSAKITVVWTPYGGAEATIAIVSPGGMIAFWEEVTASGNGISSLKLTSDTANATFELFIGG